MKILVVGGWHLGSTIACCMARNGHETYLWDQSLSVSNSWKKGQPPLFEPGLQDIIDKTWGRNLFWHDMDVDRADGSGSGEGVQDPTVQWDWIFVCYDTPVNEKDEVDLNPVLQGFNLVLEKQKISVFTHFMVTCQVPVGTSRKLLSQVRQKVSDWRGRLIYQPENLRLGQAIDSFLTPDRAVIGFDTEDPVERARVEVEYRDLLQNENLKLDSMSLESAEMVKHVLNSFLATCVVFANEVSNICENEGANAWEVFSSLTQDSRVGKRAFLRPGLGFSGGTLARDVKILSRLAPHSNRLFSTVYEMNQKRNDWILRILKNKFTDGLRDRTIVLVGITYKPNTSTVRRSPAVEIAELLRTEGAKCNAIDPKADLTEWTSEELGRLPFTFHQDFERAFWQADAAVLVTEWPEFWNYDWAGFASKMRNDRSEFSQDSTAKLADGRSALPLLIDTKNHFKNTSAVEKSWTRVVPGLPL